MELSAPREMAVEFSDKKSQVGRSLLTSTQLAPQREGFIYLKVVEV